MFNQAKGQGLIEFALFLPIIILLVIGALDVGRAFHTKVVLENAAREGAYFMVYNPEEGKVDSFLLGKEAVQIEAQNSGLNILTEEIEVFCMFNGIINNDCPKGSIVNVIVHHQLSLIFDGIFGGPFDLTNDARMLVP